MQINVNGQTYDRWEDVPEELRTQLAAALPDADHNGVPDLFEGDLGALADLAKRGRTTAVTSVTMDGHQVGSVAELPPAMQEMLRQALGMGQGAAAGAAPVTPATTTPGADAASTLPGVTPTSPGDPAQVPVAPASVAPGQVMLNGVPTDVDAAGTGDTGPKKGFLRRLFGG